MPKPTERLRYIELIKLKPTDTWTPPGGTEARIIGGIINHIAATASTLILQSDGSITYAPIVYTKATNCSASFAVNPITVSTEYYQRLTSRPDVLWFDSRAQLLFGGGTGAYVYLLIEVVKIDEYTGEHLA